MVIIMVFWRMYSVYIIRQVCFKAHLSYFLLETFRMFFLYSIHKSGHAPIQVKVTVMGITAHEICLIFYYFLDHLLIFW